MLISSLLCISSYTCDLIINIQVYLLADSFAVGEEGTILKKLSENENNILQMLMKDPLKPFVPHYKGVVKVESNRILFLTFNGKERVTYGYLGFLCLLSIYK